MHEIGKDFHWDLVSPPLIYKGQWHSQSIIIDHLFLSTRITGNKS